MINHIFLTKRFFIIFGIGIGLFLFSYGLPFLYAPAWLVFIMLVLMTLWELWRLQLIKPKLQAKRLVTEKLSLGDVQNITYRITNDHKQPVKITMIDEWPFQLQNRHFQLSHPSLAGPEWEISEKIKPLSRGKYSFGNIHLYLSLPHLTLLEVRKTILAHQDTMVFPSSIQMQKYAMEVFARTASFVGIRRIRTLGENDEFELIRNYQQGDNIRSINWKATSRKSQLMVNQYQDTRSQQVYCIIDKGRSMKMPFDGLTLLDYAINTSLVICNIVLRKYDKAGLITFSDKMGQVLAAESTTKQLNLISDLLYNQKTGFKESNYELLHHTLRRRLRRRSILLLFTNFEYMSDLERHLSFLQSLNQYHLLVVIFFINTELANASKSIVSDLEGVYLHTFIHKALREKEMIQNRLQALGIQTILTRPNDLSIEVINKYLAIKARRQS